MALTCRNVQHLHDAYIDGELSSGMTAEFQAHLIQCPECQRDVELVRTAGHLIATDHDEPELPLDFANRVLASAPAVWQTQVVVTRRQRRRLLLKRVSSTLIPAAAAVLAVSVALVPPNRPQAATRVLGDARYAPVDALGVRPFVDPTLSSLTGTGEAADSLRQLYRMTVEEAESRLPLMPVGGWTTPTDSRGFVSELLHPFIQMMSPPVPPPPAEPDGLVRF